MKQIVLLCAVLVASLVAKVHSSTYVDSTDDAVANIEQLAELLCKTTKGTQNLIGKVDTINQIIDYLGEVSSEHHLYQCGQNHLEALMQLANVVETANNDVCGDEKLALMEDFHRRYVSKVSRWVVERKRGNQAPKMAQLFFMQYATEVSSRCEQNALEVISKNKSHGGNDDNLKRLDGLRKFTDSLGMTDLSQGYTGIYLFWNMIDSLGLAENDKFSKYLTPDGAYRIHVMMRDARGINKLQAVCRHQLRPVYQRSLMPVLRLIDMGYYPHGRQLVDELAMEESATRLLFFGAQICETLLPVAAYSDEHLAQDQFVAITRNEASKLSLPKVEKLEQKLVATGKPLSFEVSPVEVQLDDFGKIMSETPVEEIKGNVAVRGKIINRMLKQMWQQMKEKLKSTFSGFKLFRRSEVGHKLEAIDELENMDGVDQALQIQEQNGGGGLSRRKRNLAHGLYYFIGFVGFMIYYIVLTIIKVALFALPTLLLVLYSLIFDDERVHEPIHWMWTSGWDPLGFWEDE